MVPQGHYIINQIFNFENFTVHIPLLIVLMFLIMASAFFSASETAYSSINVIRLRSFVDQKRRGAKKALYILSKYDLTLTTILIGNNLVNIGATTIAAYIITSTVINPTLGNVLNTVIMTLIILIFGEIMPKSYSKEHPERIALNNSSLLYILMKVLYPISWAFIKMKKLFIKDKSLFTPFVTTNELASIIDVMENEGVIEEEDAYLMQNAISLGDKTVYEIMSPRVDVIAVNVNDEIDNIKKMFFNYKYTRVPVYEFDKDNIIGILNERDFLSTYIKNQNKNFSIKSIMTKPYFVSETTKVDDLIREMQKMKKHFAIVVDEYGGTSGIVTMEDALEELVGEIYDESDDYDENDDPENIEQLGENKYKVSAEMELEFLFEKLTLGKFPKTKYSTVGGFVYELSGELPYKGMQVLYNTVYEKDEVESSIFIEYLLTFSITEMNNRRIKSIVIDIKDITEEAA